MEAFDFPELNSPDSSEYDAVSHSVSINTLTIL